MSTSTRYPLLLVATGAHALLSVGHTLKGQELFSQKTITALSNPLRGAVKIGWYEGSVFFAILSILNYKWSQTGLIDSADKAVAGLITSLLLGAGTSYYRTGDTPTGVILAVIGAIQGWAAKQAAL